MNATPASDTTAWHHLPANPYNPHAWFVGEPVIGEQCWIGAFTVIDGSGGLSIGRGCDISAGAQIYSHSTVRRALSGKAGELTVTTLEAAVSASTTTGSEA